MNPIPIVFENGVFRPTVPVILPEGTTGEAVVANGADDSEPRGCNSPELYALLSERFNSGDPYGAERHNEHQP